MKIAIVGAGSMGSFLGALLTLAGEDVWLVDRSAENVRAMQENGLVIVKDTCEQRVRVKATTCIQDADNSDLVIIFVKAYDTLSAVRDCHKIVGEKTTVLTLQNGIGNLEIISEELGSERVIAGTTSIACTGLGPARVKLCSLGQIIIGEYNGIPSARLVEIASAFSKAGISTEISSSVTQLIWEKLIVNIGINALTAITGITNGQLLQYDSSIRLVELAVSEAVEVARSKGIAISLIEMLQKVFQIARATGSNRSSMLQDIERNAKTEINAINGAVVREGRTLGVATPVNETLALLIKTLEAKNCTCHK